MSAPTPRSYWPLVGALALGLVAFAWLLQRDPASTQALEETSGGAAASSAATSSDPAGDAVGLDLGPSETSQGSHQRIALATAGLVDLVTRLVSPDRVVLLPEAAMSFSRLAREPGPWAEVPRFEGFQAEPFLAARADLVLGAGWQSPETVQALRASGVRVVVFELPATWEGVLSEVDAVAELLEAVPAGRRLRDELTARRDALRPRATRSGAGRRGVSYTNLGTGGWVAGRGTTADILFSLAGLENAAASAGFEGHRQIDLEGLLNLRPELFVVGAANAGEGIASTRAYLEAQPVLAGLPAIAGGQIVALPQELYTTASVELLTAAESLVETLEALDEGADTTR